MKKLLILPLLLVLLAPVCALPFMTVNAPSQAPIDQQFTISVIVEDSQGGLQSIQFYREGILKTTHPCSDADDTEYKCTFGWQTSEANIGKVSYKVEGYSDYDSDTIIDATAEKEFTIDIIAAVSDSTPRAIASANPTSGKAPLIVNFQGSAIGGDAPITYRWNFGDGQTSSLQNPTHTYGRTGTYTATLTVTDADGDSDADQVTIRVRSRTYVSNGGGGGPRRPSYSGSVPTIDTPKEKSTSSMIKKIAGELELSENFIEVEAGETHKIQLTIKNTGSKITQYNLNIAGLEGTYEIEPVLVTMSPNQELTVYAYLNINDRAEGQHVATISLISDSQILDGEALIVEIQEQQIPYTIMLFGAVLILVALITAAAFAFRE